MRVAVFGLGYVGSVTAACLTHQGHDVIGVDVAPRKVEQFQQGVASVSEPGLDELLADAVACGRLRATRSAEEAVRASDLSLICVGTPSRTNGSLDTRHVEHVCEEIGDALRDHREDHVVVVRSTVLPGTTLQRLQPLLLERSSAGHGSGHRAPTMAVNPEFLREGSAVRDFFEPSVVVVGSDDDAAGARVAELYAGLDAPIVQVPITTAEMVKYVNNAFHALKITFANEVGVLSKANGVDGRKVMEILAMDTRLNVSKAYLRPGFAFGGSCLPKDMRALLHRASELDVAVPMLAAIPASNEQQVQRAVRVVESAGRRSIGILGLAFKSGTDDVRESPSVPLIEALIGRGHQVVVYDDTVVPERLIGANRAYVERELPHIASIMRHDLDDMLATCDVVVVATASPTFRDVHRRMRTDQVLVDLVDGLDGTVAPDGPQLLSIAW